MIVLVFDSRHVILHGVVLHSYPRLDSVGYQARIQLLAKGEVVKIMENNVLLPQAATACHENEFRNQLVYEL